MAMAWIKDEHWAEQSLLHDSRCVIDLYGLPLNGVGNMGRHPLWIEGFCGLFFSHVHKTLCLPLLLFFSKTCYSLSSPPLTLALEISTACETESARCSTRITLHAPCTRP